MVNKEILKTAALQLRNLSQQRKEALTSLEKIAMAEQIVKKMMLNQEMTGEEVLQKLSEFKQKPIEELNATLIAFNLVKTGSAELGTLSDVTSPDETTDNLTYYLLYGESQ